MTELAQGYLSLSVGLDHPGESVAKWLSTQQKAVDVAGKAMGKSLSGGLNLGAERAKADAEQAKRAFDIAAKAATAASEKQEAADRKVQIAEAKLTETREKYAKDSSQVLTAEDRLASAKGAAAKASLAVTAAEAKQAAAADKVKAALAEQTAATEKAGTESERSAGRIRTAFSKLGAKLSNPFGGLPADADESGQKSGEKFTEGFKSSGPSFGSMFKASFLGNFASSAITSSIGLIKQSLSSGFSRLESIDQATQKLKGLGNSAGQTKTIMDNALASVKGTAFGMGDAATVAATMVAAGIKPGAQLQKTLSLVADSATIAGADMGDMGAIFSKVATSGKLQGDDLQQLGDRGIPIVALLAKTMGKTSAQVYDLASKGKVDFATFQKAMESGMGGAAKTSGDTFTGAMANVKAALGRIGADVLQGAFGQAPDAFKNLTGQIDALAPKAEAVGAAVSRFASGLADVVKWGVQNKAWILPFAAGITGVVAAWKSYQVVMRAVEIAQLALNVVMNANPIGLIALAVAGLVAGFTYAYKHSEKFRNGVNGALNGVKNVALAVGRWFSGPFVNFFKSGFNSVKNAATAVKNGIVSVFTAMKNGVVSVARTLWNGVKTAFNAGKTAVMAIVNVFKNGVVNVWGAMKSSVSKVASTLWNGVKTAFNAGKTAVMAIVNVFKNGVVNVWDAMKSSVSKVASTLWNGVKKTFTTMKNGVVNIFTAMKDAVGKVWNGIQSVVGKPIRFVIDTVINKGILGAYNWVAGKIGAKKLGLVAMPKGLRSGGVVPGTFDRAHRDNVLGVSSAGMPVARVEPGEMVINRRSTARYASLLHAINADRLPGYARGGVVGGVGRWSQLFAARMQAAAGALGAMLRISQRGFRPRTSYSGTSHRGDAVDVVGGANLWSIRDALRRQGIAAWVRGPKQGYSWHVHGIPLPGAGVALGSAVYQQQAYARHADGLHGFSPDVYDSPSGGSWTSRAWNAVKGVASTIWGGFTSAAEWVKNKISGMAGDFGGAMVKRFGHNAMIDIVKAVPAKIRDMVVDKANSLLSFGSDGADVQGSGIGRWRSAVDQALRISGIGGGASDENLWLKQIQTESDGNPRLIQSSKVYDVNIARGDPARGLVQVPGVTWADFGKDMGPFLPNVYNPLKNLIVGMRAANAQHRNWRAVIGKGHGYQEGGIVPRNEIAALSEDGRPELVVGPQMRALNSGSRVFNADQTRALLGQAAALRIVSGRLDLNMTDGGAYIYATAMDAIDDRAGDLNRMGAR